MECEIIDRIIFSIYWSLSDLSHDKNGLLVKTNNTITDDNILGHSMWDMKLLSLTYCNMVKTDLNFTAITMHTKPVL